MGSPVQAARSAIDNIINRRMSTRVFSAAGRYVNQSLGVAVDRGPAES
jgi:hypothetical protein